MFDLFQYSFVLRGFEAGLLIGLIAPLIGIFLVLRGYSLITDTLAHVSLAGVAFGFFMKWNPVVTALLVTVLSSVGIDRLRTSGKIFGESALAVFLFGSLALATILLSLAQGFNTNLLNYLFGSLVTVTREDLGVMLILALVVFGTIAALYKQLIFVSFDETAARVSGVPVRIINTAFIMLAATTVALAVPVVGVLLIGALMVIPVLTALQFSRGFFQTILIAEAVSLTSIFIGIYASYYLNIATGGTIVCIALLVFATSALYVRMFRRGRLNQ